MNLAFFRLLWRRNLAKVLAVFAGATLWGFLAAVIYQAIAAAIQGLPKIFNRFGSGDLTTFPGVITVMFEHPLLVALACTIVVGVTVPAIAGQRQRGTLEMVLARPIGRARLINTVALTVITMLLLTLLGTALGILLGSAFEGLTAEVPLRALLLVWLNSTLLYCAFAAVALASSASANRNGPAVAVTLAFLIVNYFIEVLGGYWEPAQPWQPYGLFHHFNAAAILGGGASFFDFALLAAVAAAAYAFAVWRFTSRDIPAPD
ncbi:MAG: hypothetical protein ACR2GX_01780 [Candidatus Dormibacteria bacterium]